jgi:hypothetical protein
VGRHASRQHDCSLWTETELYTSRAVQWREWRARVEYAKHRQAVTRLFWLTYPGLLPSHQDVSATMTIPLPGEVAG